jgi:hypothetical protein
LLGFDGKLRHGIAPLTGMWADDFVYFSTYALSGLVLPFSSFFTLLEYYELQLHHLLPHSIMLVMTFVHLCEMYMCVWPSVWLFCHFHVLRSSRNSPSPLSGYYFQHQTKGPSVYITTLSPGKWDCWRENWVIMQADAHDRLELPIVAPTGSCSDWDKVSALQRVYNLVFERI